MSYYLNLIDLPADIISHIRLFIPVHPLVEYFKKHTVSDAFKSLLFGNKQYILKNYKRVCKQQIVLFLEHTTTEKLEYIVKRVSKYNEREVTLFYYLKNIGEL